MGVLGDIAGIPPSLGFLEYEIEGDVGIVIVPNNLFRELVFEREDVLKNLLKVNEIRVKINPKVGRRIREGAIKTRSMVKNTGTVYGEPLSLKYLPGEFVVSSYNEKAVETAEEVAFGEGSSGMSVTVTGPPGVGKTHLLQYIGWKAILKGRDVMHYKAEELISVVSSAFKNKTTESLRMELTPNVSLLLIDDFQNFDQPKLESVRNFLFDILDAHLRKGTRVVVTSDVQPFDWEYIEERIKQRLTLAGVERLPMPDGKFARAFVFHKLALEGKEITDEALQLVEDLSVVSVRGLQRLCFALLAREDGVITPEVMETVIAQVFSVAEITTSTEKWVWKNLLYQFLPSHDAQRILEGGRKSLDSKAQSVRKAFVEVLKEHGYSYSRIASFFGVTHTAVIGWVKREPKDVFVYRAALEKGRQLFAFASRAVGRLGEEKI